MKIKSNCKKILDEMRVLPNIDPQFEVNRRVTFIKSKLLNTGLSHLVLGISGGIDSATCGRLAQIAINELNQEFHERKKQVDEIDAQKSIKFICPSKNIHIDIKPSVDITHERINSSIGNSNLGLVRDEVRDDFTKGNTKARIRMIFQYEVASALGGLVLGTDHSAENITGFYTKWGDGACDLAPLFGLNKRQIRKIARFLNAPTSIIEKPPTADLECLSPQKEDEHVLGVTYNEIDDFLEGKPLAQDSLKTILNLYNKTIHKRSTIPTIYD